MLTSRLADEGRTALPQAVCKALRLEPGDEVAYEILGDRVILSRAETEDADAEEAAFFGYCSGT